MTKQSCPHCGADLRGAPIPQDYIDAGYYPSGAMHYERVIGVEVRGLYDGVLFWACPDCGGTWHRFPEGNPYRRRAEPYVSEPAS